jgi:PadR family transcriptional regulator AphA
MEPTAVTWVVLGLLALGARTGYDVKRVVDKSIRYFWAASYGQIYPELKRLEEGGWIVGEHAPRGARARRVYELTPAGRKALREWLHGTETRIETRDESLRRLFFADALPREEALGLLRGRREGYRQLHAYLRSLEEGAPSDRHDPPFVNLVFRWAVDYCEWGMEWCERQERRLRRAA